MKQSLITIMIVALCVSFIGCASHRKAESEPIEEFPALANIKSIFITDLGNEEGAGVVSEKIRLRLMKSTRFSLVEVADRADAILKGVAGVERSVTGGGHVYEGSGSSYVSTIYTGFAVLRLVDTKTQETIWSFEYKKRCRQSASSCVADATVDKLIKDAERADDKARNDRLLQKENVK